MTLINSKETKGPIAEVSMDQDQLDMGSTASHQEGKSEDSKKLLPDSFYKEEIRHALRELSDFIEKNPPVVIREPQFYYPLFVKGSFAAILACNELKLHDFKKRAFLILISTALYLKGSGIYDFFEYYIRNEIQIRKAERISQELQGKILKNLIYLSKPE